MISMVSRQADIDVIEEVISRPEQGRDGLCHDLNDRYDISGLLSKVVSLHIYTYIDTMRACIEFFLRRLLR